MILLLFNSFTKKLLLIINFLFIPAILFGNPVELLFNKIKKNNSQLPKRFTCEIKSLILNLQLENIPPDMIEFEKTPTLYLEFKKNENPKLILKGVLPYYQGFFLPYQEFLTKSGLFIGVDSYNSFKKLKKDYLIQIKKLDKNHMITLRERDGLKGDYAKYYFNELNQLRKAFYYEDNIQNTELSFFYQKIKTHKLPKRIIVRINKKNRKSEHFIDFEKCRI